MNRGNIRLSIGATLLVVFIGMQFSGPEIPNPIISGDFKAPDEVKAIFKKACYDCHSNETNLRWYDKVAPISWQVADHIRSGRAGLNFSEWDKLSPIAQKAKLWESLNQILAGAMPLESYQMVHSQARLSKKDITVLKAYLMGMVKNTAIDATKADIAQTQSLYSKKNKRENQSIPVAPNGIAYLPDYKNWAVISSTERFDNGTMRIVYGNDIALQAVRSGQVNPWPNGAILAKVAWDQQVGKDGRINTGDFKQIEYMIKDDKKYAATHGWGFARFKTPQLVPYGKTAMFTTECINCHKPVADRDFVFTSPLNN